MCCDWEVPTISRNHATLRDVANHSNIDDVQIDSRPSRPKELRVVLGLSAWRHFSRFSSWVAPCFAGQWRIQISVNAASSSQEVLTSEIFPQSFGSFGNSLEVKGTQVSSRTFKEVHSDSAMIRSVSSFCPSCKQMQPLNFRNSPEQLPMVAPAPRKTDDKITRAPQSRWG